MTSLSAVFLDLDDTLLDTAGILLGPARLDAGAAMVEAGLPGTAEEAAAGLERLARLRPGEDPFPLLAASRGVDDVRIGIAGWGAFFRRPVPDNLPTASGAAEALRMWGEDGVRRLLVTFGDPPTQRAKIAAMGLEPLLDRVVYEPLGPGVDKGRAFRLLVDEEGLDPATCAVIGDRPDAEIAAGRALGMFTVRLQRGEHRHMEPADPLQEADRTVATFAEAASIVNGR